MLFIVIERFKNSDPKPVGERFKKSGRMLPEGVEYKSSWMEASGGRCFQLMTAPDAAALKPWMARWDDLVDFEVITIVPSGEFWS
jgi:hypothetical protein